MDKAKFPFRQVDSLTNLIYNEAKKSGIEMTKKKAKKFALNHLGLGVEKEFSDFRTALGMQNDKW